MEPRELGRRTGGDDYALRLTSKETQAGTVAFWGLRDPHNQVTGLGWRALWRGDREKIALKVQADCTKAVLTFCPK